MKKLLCTLAVFAMASFFVQAEEAAAVEAPKMEKATFAVTGMTCGGCEGKLKKMLTGLEGVECDTICSKGNKAAVTYNPETTSKDDLIKTIKESGFKFAGEQVTVPVKGMTCGGCSGKVSKVLAGVDGVSSQDVCHKSSKAVITFDPEKTDKDKLVAAINGTGFKAGE